MRTEQRKTKYQPEAQEVKSMVRLPMLNLENFIEACKTVVLDSVRAFAPWGCVAILISLCLVYGFCRSKEEN